MTTLPGASCFRMRDHVRALNAAETSLHRQIATADDLALARRRLLDAGTFTPAADLEAIRRDGRRALEIVQGERDGLLSTTCHRCDHAPACHVLGGMNADAAV